LQEFLKMMATFQAELPSRSVDESIARILDRSGYLGALNAEGTPEAESRIDNLKELLSSAEDFHIANQGMIDADRSELELFLDQVALVSDLDSYDRENERVSLMTAHSAKGLEFPIVYMVGMEEGIFPHASSSRDPDGVEEERRLCYVGMTRAMQQLCITYARERRRFGERSYQSPSRFLREIPEELIEASSSPTRRQGRAQPNREGRSLDYSSSQEAAVPDVSGLVGMRVRHPVFGVGDIVSVIGEGLNQKLKIRFERAGVKTVMVRYANLEPA
jgi:DNA helicase-2/ATP-dependent DNA helicase PcrA